MTSKDPPKYYDIEKILGKKIMKGEIHYKIKWKGFKMNQCTWEPEKNVINASYAINEFERILQKRIKKKKVLYKSNINKEKELEKEQDKKSDMVNGNEENSTKKEIKEIIHKVDKSFTKVINVRRSSNRLMVLVDKEKENGEIVKAYISTEELGRINPWILLDYYESKIKFIKIHSFDNDNYN